MDINNKSFQSLSEYIVHIFSLFVPGIIILELVFKVGLFHTKVTSLIDFILFLVWSFIFSFPFHLFTNLIDTDDFPDEKQSGRFYSMIELPFFILLPL